MNHLSRRTELPPHPPSTFLFPECIKWGVNVNTEHDTVTLRNLSMPNENSEESESELCVAEALDPGFPKELYRIFVTNNLRLGSTPRISDPSYM